MREEEQRRGGKESKGSKRGRKFRAPERELVQSWKTKNKKEIEAVGSNPRLRQHSLAEAGPGLQQGCGKGVLQPGAQAPGQEWG